MAVRTAAVEAFLKRVESKKQKEIVAAENASRYTQMRDGSEFGKILPWWISIAMRTFDSPSMMNAVQNQASQCAQFGRPIIFIDSFNRRSFSCTTFRVIVSALYMYL